MLAVHCSDALAADYTQASVVMAYLSETGNSKLLPVLRAAAGCRRSASLPPARLVTFSFPVAGLKPTATVRVDGIDLYLYTVEE